MKIFNVKRPLNDYNKKAKENEQKLIQTMEDLVIEHHHPEPVFQNSRKPFSDYKKKKPTTFSL